MEALHLRMKSLKTSGKRIVICADWNTCHQNVDIKNWKANQKNSGFLPNERAWLDNLITVEGWRDCFRDIAQEPDSYSWWSNRGRAYENNVGWRLDYQLVSSTEETGLAKTYIDRAAQLSDHAPVTHWYEWELYP
jgi:exodeoxyribonuclease-3